MVTLVLHSPNTRFHHIPMDVLAVGVSEGGIRWYLRKNLGVFQRAEGTCIYVYSDPKG